MQSIGLHVRGAADLKVSPLLPAPPVTSSLVTCRAGWIRRTGAGNKSVYFLKSRSRTFWEAWGYILAAWGVVLAPWGVILGSGGAILEVQIPTGTPQRTLLGIMNQTSLDS